MALPDIHKTDETCGFSDGGRGDDACQNPPHDKYGDNGRCWIPSHNPHRMDGEGGGDGDGAPEDPPADQPGPPDGNFNGVTDGLSMPVKRRLDLFREVGEPLMSLFEDYYVTYRAKAENKVEAASLASAAVIRDELEAHLFTDGMFYTQQVGNPAEYDDPDDAFIQKPKTETLESYHDARREVRLGLKYEGVNDRGASGGSTGHSGISAMWEDEPGEGEA